MSSPSCRSLLNTLLLASLAACGGDRALGPSGPTDRTPTTSTPLGAPITVAATRSAWGPDSTIAVAMRASGDKPVTGIQADLTFDPALLTYRGLQIAESPSALVQVHEVEPGVVRVAVAAARGELRADAVVLRFRSATAEAGATLRVRASGAVAVVGLDEERPVRVDAAAPRLDQSLRIWPTEQLDAAQWTARLGASPDGLALSLPTGRIYGDPNNTNTISVADAVLVLNYSVGALTPTPTQFESANLAPNNFADGVEVDLPDPCRPGRTCTSSAPFSETGPGGISVADVVVILNAGVGNPAPVAGRSIPAPAGRVAGRVTSPARGALPGVTVNVLSGGGTAVTNATGDYLTPLVLAGTAALTVSGLPSDCTDPGLLLVSVLADVTSTRDISVSCALTSPRLAAGLGNSHSCELSALGLAVCWGSNSAGELGDGTTSAPRPLRGPVQQPAGVTFAEIVTGARHTCARSTTGQVYCWGDNAQSQLGVTGALAPTPQLVGNLGVPITGLAAGTQHTCARGNNGSAFCWGENTFGQTGVAPTSFNVPVSTATLIAPTSSNPPTYAQLTAGANHSCGVTAAGAVRCWGRNDLGQLGVSPATTGGATHIAQSVNLGGAPLVFSQVSAGGLHTCALTTTNQIWCWGNNAGGQLGNGSTGGFSATPVRAGSTTSPIAFVQVDAGLNHTCAVAQAGTVYCWGENPLLQVGNNPAVVSSPTLMATPAGVTFVEVAAGNTNSCARSTTGTTFCWGGNNDGQLGLGTTSPNPTPTPTAVVPTGTIRGVVSIPARGPNSFALFVQPDVTYASNLVLTNNAGAFSFLRRPADTPLSLAVVAGVPSDCVVPPARTGVTVTTDAVTTVNITVECPGFGTVNGTIVRSGPGFQSWGSVGFTVTPAAAGTTPVTGGASETAFVATNVAVGAGAGAGSGSVSLGNLATGCELSAPVNYSGLTDGTTVNVTASVFCAQGIIVGTIVRQGAGTQNLDGSTYTITPADVREPAVSGVVSGLTFRNTLVRIGSGTGVGGAGTVTLGNLPTGCTLLGNAFYSGMTLGATVAVTLTVRCDVPTGTIAGTIERQGTGTQSLNGSTYTITPSDVREPAVSGQLTGLTFQNNLVRIGSGAGVAGAGTVVLSNLPVGCASPGNATYSGLTLGATVNVTMTVQCAAQQGTVSGTVSQQGSSLDLNGSTYVIRPQTLGTAQPTGQIANLAFSNSNVPIGSSFGEGRGKVVLSAMPNGCVQLGGGEYEGLATGPSVATPMRVTCLNPATAGEVRVINQFGALVAGVVDLTVLVDPRGLVGTPQAQMQAYQSTIGLVDGGGALTTRVLAMIGVDAPNFLLDFFIPPIPQVTVGYQGEAVGGYATPQVVTILRYEFGAGAPVTLRTVTTNAQLRNPAGAVLNLVFSGAGRNATVTEAVLAVP